MVTIRRDTRRNDAGYRFGRSKECFRRRHVAGLAQPHVHKGTETIDRAVQEHQRPRILMYVSSTYQLFPIRPLRRPRKLSMRDGVSFVSQSRTASAESEMTPAACRYAMTRIWRTESGRPAASIRFRTATPMAASVR